jgi:hypothetical protein
MVADLSEGYLIPFESGYTLHSTFIADVNPRSGNQKVYSFLVDPAEATSYFFTIGHDCFGAI